MEEDVTAGQSDGYWGPQRPVEIGPCVPVEMLSKDLATKTRASGLLKVRMSTEKRKEGVKSPRFAWLSRGPCAETCELLRGPDTQLRLLPESLFINSTFAL